MFRLAHNTLDIADFDDGAYLRSMSQKNITYQIDDDDAEAFKQQAMRSMGMQLRTGDTPARQPLEPAPLHERAVDDDVGDGDVPPPKEPEVPRRQNMSKSKQVKQGQVR